MRSLVLAAGLIFALSASARAQLTPPSVLEAPPPRYPESALHGDHHGHEETVIVHVTIGADGALQAAHVDHSISPEFDAAALEAVRRWRFAPARQGETPIASNVRVAVRFVLPEIELHAHPPVIAPPEAPVVRGDAQPGRTDTEAHAELSATATVQASAPRPAAHAASDFVIERAVLTAAPRKDAAALLSAAPGVYVARSEGEPIAPSIFLRGFDAEHGQDIAFSAGGLPINAPSHVHGQGYADIGFVIPEAVRYMRVTEGVYDPRQGDFAVAGSIDFELGVEERGLHARTSYGSFDAFRQLVLWAPEGQPVESFGGVFYARTDGFGAQRAGASAGALAQHVLGTGPFRLRLIGSLYGARAELPGMVHREDYEAGEVGFYGVEDDPIARSQAASASEARLGMFLERASARGGKSELGLWLAQQSFEAQEGLTGHAHDHAGGEDGGDLNEQLNDARSIGISARHMSERYRLARWLDARLDAGLAGRFDRIEQRQRLLHAPPEASVDPQVDASIAGTSIGGHADLELRVQKRLSLHAGVRADALHYAVEDRLATLDTSVAEDGRIAGLSRSAFGVAAGPRLRAELKLTPWLSALAAYGQGFRSPQANALADGADVRYAKVHSSDAGVRAGFERASISASAFHTALSQDFAFDADEGRLEPLGATTRTGGVLHATVRPLSFLIASASITYVNAVLDEGGQIPYVPPLVVRADLGYDQRIGRAFGSPLGLRAGLGVSQLGERPLPVELSSEPLTLCDASLALGYGPVELGVETFNLFDARYAASEHVSPPDEAGEPPARFFAAGPPRSVMFTLALTL